MPAMASSTGPIPAYAGETFSVVPGVSVLEGLSPHTRGKLLQLVAVARAGGPIPAYAGETHR